MLCSIEGVYTIGEEHVLNANTKRRVRPFPPPPSSSSLFSLALFVSLFLPLLSFIELLLLFREWRVVGGMCYGKHILSNFLLGLFWPIDAHIPNKTAVSFLQLCFLSGALYRCKCVNPNIEEEIIPRSFMIRTTVLVATSGLHHIIMDIVGGGRLPLLDN